MGTQPGRLVLRMLLERGSHQAAASTSIQVANSSLTYTAVLLKIQQLNCSLKRVSAEPTRKAQAAASTCPRDVITAGYAAVPGRAVAGSGGSPAGCSLSAARG